MEVAAGELYSGSFQVLSAQNLETSCAEDHESQALVGQVAVHSALQFTIASHRIPSHPIARITSHPTNKRQAAPDACLAQVLHAGKGAFLEEDLFVGEGCAWSSGFLDSNDIQ